MWTWIIAALGIAAIATVGLGARQMRDPEQREGAGKYFAFAAALMMLMTVLLLIKTSA